MLVFPGLVMAALGLWMRRKPENAGRVLESWKSEVYDPSEEYLAHLRFGGTALTIVGTLTACAALLD